MTGKKRGMAPDTKKTIAREGILLAAVPLYWVYFLIRSAMRAARRYRRSNRKLKCADKPK
ncbi:hypothetical protein ACFL42_01640 [Candidatus Omnitrophota bacterium]